MEENNGKEEIMADHKYENQPATKEDLELVKTGLHAEIQSVKTDVKRLEDIVKTNTIDILHIKNDIRDIRETMSTKNDISRVLNHIDAFAAEALSYRNHETLRGGKIMEHETKLENHETRLSELETNPR